MALFKTSAKIVPATIEKPGRVKVFDLRSDTIIYHHCDQNHVTKDECPCKELVRAHTSDVGGEWYGCVFCGFTVFAKTSEVEVSSEWTVTTYA